MKVGQQSATVASSHSEKDIDAKYIHEDDGEKLCYITDFEFRDVGSNLFKSPETLSDEGVCLILNGCLLTPKQVKSSNFESNYRVSISNLTQWVFDYGEKPETKGVWVQTKKYWYKLIKPSEYFKFVYGPFEKKSNIWLDLRPILLKWMKKFDKCSDDEVNSVLDLLSMDFVIEIMNKKGYSENDIIENAYFIYDKAVQDGDSFSLDDDEEVNQVLRTSFMKDLIDKSSIKNMKKLVDSPREKYIENSDSYLEEYIVNIPIDSSSDSSSDSEEEYKYEEDKLTEEEYISHDEEEEYMDEKVESKKRKSPISTNKQTKKVKRVSSPKSDEESDEEKPRFGGNGEIHVTTYQLEPGVPSAEELLSQQFTPRLLTKLSLKYDDGVVPTLCKECRKHRITCPKERPMCSHCLEKGVPCVYPKYLRLAPCIPCSQNRSRVCDRQKPSCNHCKEGECFYFVADTSMIIAQMKIQATKELYAKLDAETTEVLSPSIPISPTLDEVSIEMEEENERLEENKKKAIALKEEIEKWKKVVEKEKKCNAIKMKELGVIISKVDSE